jgi:hypothetical protein
MFNDDSICVSLVKHFNSWWALLSLDALAAWEMSGGHTYCGYLLPHLSNKKVEKLLRGTPSHHQHGEKIMNGL